MSEADKHAIHTELDAIAEALDKGHRVALDVGVALCSGLHR